MIIINDFLVVLQGFIIAKNDFLFVLPGFIIAKKFIIYNIYYVIFLFIKPVKVICVY